MAHASTTRGGWAQVGAPTSIFKRVKTRMARHRLSMIAAGVAFYGLLAIFPGLLAVVTIYGLVADPQQVQAQMAAVSDLLPPEAADILLGQLRDLVQTDRTALGIGAISGVLLALWSASAGVRTLMEALNIVYDEEEKRGTLGFYATALVLTLAAVVGLVFAIAIVVAVPVVVGVVGLGDEMGMLIAYARWPMVAVAVMLGLAVMYRYGPSRTNRHWAWLTWGSAIATALWLVGSSLFSLYVTKFGNYNATYGSMAAVVILLMWFLLTSYVVLIGAEIDAEREAPARNRTAEAEAV